MSLLSNLIGVADTLTHSFGLQATCLYYAFTSADSGGTRQYAPAVQRTCIYERKQKLVRGFTGEMVVSNAQVTFLDPTPVGEYDRIVLPFGGVLDSSPDALASAQPIIGTDSFVDASNGGVLTQIYLG